MKRCVVLGAVEIDFPIEKYIRESDFVICADRGWKHAKAHGIKPDMIVGDFDSSPQPEDTDASVTIRKFMKSKKLSKAMVDAFVNSIVVDNDGEFDVSLKIKDEYDELMKQLILREGDLANVG